jgi:RES domain
VPESIPLQLFRVTRHGHDTLFPPPRARYRFDDPARGFATLYAAMERPAAFAESLQQFRPDLATRVELAKLRFAEVTTPVVSLRTWTAGRVLLRLRLPATARLLDLRDSAAIEMIADSLAEELLALGCSDFDLSTLLGSDRRTTQTVAAWAARSDHDGIILPSRFASTWSCVSVFNSTKPRIIGHDDIASTDPDLMVVAQNFGLRISG